MQLAGFNKPTFWYGPRMIDSSANWAEIATAVTTTVAALTAGALWLWRKRFPHHGLQAVLTGETRETDPSTALATIIVTASDFVLGGDPRMDRVTPRRNFFVAKREGDDDEFRMLGAFTQLLDVDEFLTDELHLVFSKPKNRDWSDLSIHLRIELRSPTRRIVTLRVDGAINSHDAGG